MALRNDRRCFELLPCSKCRRPAPRCRTLPVPVILKRLATDFLVLIPLGRRMEFSFSCLFCRNESPIPLWRFAVRASLSACPDGECIAPLSLWGETLLGQEPFSSRALRREAPLRTGGRSSHAKKPSAAPPHPRPSIASNAKFLPGATKSSSRPATRAASP